MRGFLEAALRPHPRRQQLLRGEVWHCPLCGFLLPNDWDGHFLPCVVRHAREIVFQAAVVPSTAWMSRANGSSSSATA